MNRNLFNCGISIGNCGSGNSLHLQIGIGVFAGSWKHTFEVAVHHRDRTRCEITETIR